MANNGKLNLEIIPKVKIIENWISRYSITYKCEIVVIALKYQK